MGDVSSSYCDVLVSHLVEDEPRCGGDETGYHNIETTCSRKGPDKTLVRDSDREHYPGHDDGEDLSGIELGRQGRRTGIEKTSVSIFHFASLDEHI